MIIVLVISISIINSLINRNGYVLNLIAKKFFNFNFI